MELKNITGNYIVFVVLSIFGFIVFWRSFLKEDYFTLAMALLLLLISQFKIESICHNKTENADKMHHKKHEHHKDRLHHRIKHHIKHHANKAMESELFSKLKNAIYFFRAAKLNKASETINLQKPFRSSLHETFLDDMYKQIQDAGQINVAQLASRYGLSLSALEEFVKVLDKEKLVELYYPAIGIPVVRRLNYVAEMKLKKEGKNGLVDDSNNSIVIAAKKQKIINLALFGILMFAVVMIGYLVYLNRFG